MSSYPTSNHAPRAQSLVDNDIHTPPVRTCRQVASHHLDLGLEAQCIVYDTSQHFSLFILGGVDLTLTYRQAFHCVSELCIKLSDLASKFVSVYQSYSPWITTVSGISRFCLHGKSVRAIPQANHEHLLQTHLPSKDNSVSKSETSGGTLTRTQHMKNDNQYYVEPILADRIGADGTTENLID